MRLHIISFDIPYPPNYGGIIDVFYKIRALHREGFRIVLHCFEYDRAPAPELEPYCETVYYYPRKTGVAANLSNRPYIVQSRTSKELITNLMMDNAPVLMEGLHTCHLLEEPTLRNRVLIYRESNIEHQYYFHLFRSEKHPFKKLFFLLESIRLAWFQKVLKNASLILTVSENDTHYLRKHFPGKTVRHLPSFHGHDEPEILPGKGNYILYQGKLSVPENYRAVDYILEKIWIDSMPELVIAGMDPPDWLKPKVSRRANVRLVENPDQPEMEKLIRHAQVNLMITFQATGLKLKLIHALFNGRHCLVNPKMISGTGLEEICNIAMTPPGFRDKINQLYQTAFDTGMIESRKMVLTRHYSDRNNCKLLTELLNLY